jgi:hypothetical protein
MFKGKIQLTKTLIITLGASPDSPKTWLEQTFLFTQSDQSSTSFDFIAKICLGFIVSLHPSAPLLLPQTSSPGALHHCLNDLSTTSLAHPSIPPKRSEFEAAGCKGVLLEAS